MNYFKYAIDSIRETKNLIISVLISFFVMFIFGFIFPYFFVEIRQMIVESLLADIAGKNLYEITIFIIFTNIKTAFLSIVLGIFFGIFPIFALVVNGYLVGSISRIVVDQFSFLQLIRLLPHGVFEIPAITIAFAYGIKIGLTLFRKDIKKNLIKNYKDALIVLVFVIIPLLIVAGIIEGLLFTMIGSNLS